MGTVEETNGAVGSNTYLLRGTKVLKLVNRRDHSALQT